MSDGQATMGFGTRVAPAPEAVQADQANRGQEQASNRGQEQASRTSRVSKLHTAPKRQRGVVLFTIVVGAALYYGWQSKVEQHLTAESGLGYLLGIVGGGLMLLLLLYPLRKRFRFMRLLGATKHWFRIHMLLGVVGPILILFHANFGLGSLNSNIALISMLLVAGSGLVGRYFYSKIHYGLYGRKMNLAELREITEDSGSRLGSVLSSSPELKERLHKYEQSVLKPPSTFLHSVARVVFMGIRVRLARAAVWRILKRGLKSQAAQAGWSRAERRRHAKEARQYLSVYFATARKVVGFNLYERLFALWHVLHVPLFIILVITSVMHVLAVHMY